MSVNIHNESLAEAAARLKDGGGFRAMATGGASCGNFFTIFWRHVSVVLPFPPRSVVRRSWLTKVLPSPRQCHSTTNPNLHS